jgi:serine/threonine protein phosphatase 1
LRVVRANRRERIGPIGRLDDACLPDGELVYAIGDIHGRADLVSLLLAHIAADAAASRNVTRRTLIFVGDYVDRGPDSRQVVETLISGLPQGFDVHFLKGNHEAILLDFLEDASWLDYWRANGADPTLLSYSVDVEGLVRTKAPSEEWRRAFVAALPETHRRFYQGLELMVSRGSYLFAHAGVRPGVPLEAQEPHDLIWIRGDFLESEEPFGKVVVHGHTPAVEPQLRANRIGIDTGACFTGRLTALKLQDRSKSFLQT